MSEFDFDEWAALYQRDPRAFESRRQMVLAIELAKGGPLVAPARAALRKLEATLADCPDDERASKSFVWMIASMQQLNSKMLELSARMTTLGKTLERTRG
jgi:hypothetical protein